MEKLGTLDASFFYSETSLVKNHIASLQQFELPAGTNATDFVRSLKLFIADRLHLVPYLTRKVVFSPGGIDQPVWASDGRFEINNHIEEIKLDAPANFRQVEEKVAVLHSIKMDRSRPLWSLKILTGTADGTVYYYNQVHHACLDDLAAQMALLKLTDETPVHPKHHCPADFPKAEQITLQDLFFSALENFARYQAGSADRTLRGMEVMTRLGQRALNGAEGFGALGKTGPKTQFNHQITANRSYAAGKLSLNEIKAAGQSVGASVNDVFLNLCAGGLRAYLNRRGELPSQNLIAGCPVSLRTPDVKSLGNNVTMMNVELFTEVEDTGIRLLKIRQSAKTAKNLTLDYAPAYDTNVSIPGLPLFAEAESRFTEQIQAANSGPTPVNVVISNVPGPRNTLYSNGAKMLSHYPVSIPAHGVGLNITVQGYEDQLYFGITACQSALPDAYQLRDDILAEFVALKRAILPTNVRNLSSEALTTAGAKLATAPENRAA